MSEPHEESAADRVASKFGMIEDDSFDLDQIEQREQEQHALAAAPSEITADDLALMSPPSVGISYSIDAITLSAEKIRQGATWVHGQQELGPRIDVIPLLNRTFRICFGKKYDSSRPNDGEIVCRSWNGMEAYGIGRQLYPAEGPAWRESVARQTCATPNGTVVCEAGRGDGGVWPCRPQLRLLCLVRADETLPWWTLAFFDGRGSLFYVAQNVVQQQIAAVAKARRRNPDGTFTKPHPMRFAFRIQIDPKHGGANGFQSKIIGQSVLSDQDFAAVRSQFLMPGGHEGSDAAPGQPAIVKTLWDADVAAAKRAMELVGQERQGDSDGDHG